MYNLGMVQKLDNIHYSFREIDGYNRPYNIVLGPREAGKTTVMWCSKIYPNWVKDKKPWIYLVRNATEITEALIDSIFSVNINKFNDDTVTPEYKTSDFDKGIVDVKIKGETFIRIVALSCKLRKIKLAVLKGLKGVYMDEYEVDPQSKESYIANEGFKIKEAYTTWRREADGVLKMYFTGNLYSLFNPLFISLGVPVNNARKGEFLVGDFYVFHWCTITPELKAKLLESNPLYKFDESYKGYGLEGNNLRDSNIRIGKLPPNYSLQFVFRLQNKNIGIFKNNNILDYDDLFFCKELDEVGARRCIYCFEFNDLVERAIIFSRDERNKLARFKVALRLQRVVFSDINMYYLTEEVYKYL